ncbi:hypothetical protein [Sinomonas mesophila]|uniref:hypothetical protein n=1 Tax=Sinomonas mesophila TaxID=1531955 RepID=UPI00098790D4|nr:hypothetical protein [Sinomonas mesophila]
MARTLSWTAAALAAAVLALAGCGAPWPEATAPASSAPAGASAPASAPSGGDAGATPSPTPSPALKLHNFTAHQLAFRYPAGWTVTSELHPMGPAMREIATLRTADGTEVLGVFLNWTPQDVGFEVTRSVLDAEPVPGLGSAAVELGHYAFYAETPAAGSAASGLEYFMTISPGRPIDGPGQRHGGFDKGVVQISSGYAVAADVSPALLEFESPEAARKWLASPLGQQLKEVLLSLTVY